MLQNYTIKITAISDNAQRELDNINKKLILSYSDVRKLNTAASSVQQAFKTGFSTTQILQLIQHAKKLNIPLQDVIRNAKLMGVLLTLANNKLKAGNAFSGGISKGILGTIPSLVGIGSAAMVANQAMQYLNQSFRLFDLGLKATRKLLAVLKATGYAAGLTGNQLSQFANELSDKIGKDDDLIKLNLITPLLTFRNISAPIFKEAIGLAADMNLVMGGLGITQLGKALNDPIAGIKALTRVGVMFNEQQKELIKTLQLSGDLLGAQKIILKLLSMLFQGAALAATSMADRVKVAMQRNQLLIGRQLNPIRQAFQEVQLGFINFVTGTSATLKDTVNTNVNEMTTKLMNFYNDMKAMGSANAASITNQSYNDLKNSLLKEAKSILGTKSSMSDILGGKFDDAVFLFKPKGSKERIKLIRLLYASLIELQNKFNSMSISQEKAASIQELADEQAKNDALKQKQTAAFNAAKSIKEKELALIDKMNKLIYLSTLNGRDKLHLLLNNKFVLQFILYKKYGKDTTGLIEWMGQQTLAINQKYDAELLSSKEKKVNDLSSLQKQIFAMNTSMNTSYLDFLFSDKNKSTVDFSLGAIQTYIDNLNEIKNIKSSLYAESVDLYAKNPSDKNLQLDMLIKLSDLSNASILIEQYIEKLKELQESEKAFILLNGQFVTTSLYIVTDAMTSMADTFSQSFADMAMFGTNFGKSMQRMLKQFVADMMAAIVKLLILKSVVSLLSIAFPGSGGFIGQLIPGITGWGAKANSFTPTKNSLGFSSNQNQIVNTRNNTNSLIIERLQAVLTAITNINIQTTYIDAPGLNRINQQGGIVRNTLVAVR